MDRKQFRNLGKSGLKVSVFSYGGWLTGLSLCSCCSYDDLLTRAKVGGTQNGQIVKDLIKCAWDK
jgi:aryl-alcohol dehydrogenase-like predicted oxidoreductase